jgi:hypothetical protein
MTTNLVLPSNIYNNIVLTTLYVALDNDCLPQFLACNTIKNLTSLLNTTSNGRTLLGVASMKSDDASVLSLIALGSNPLNHSLIDGLCIIDLILVAKHCEFTTYTHIVDGLIDLKTDDLIDACASVQLDHRYVEYLRDRGLETD